MQSTLSQEQLKLLTAKIDDLPPAAPVGTLLRNVVTNGFHEEPGLRFVAADFLASLHYAGLAVLSRDMHQYLDQHPREDAALFEEVVSIVHAEESRYGARAFPEHEGLDIDMLPKGLSAAAAAGEIKIGLLANPRIAHEWTVKAGKRLFLEFGAKFKETICGKDSPYEKFNKGLVGQADLPTTIAVTVLAAGFSAETFWYPLAAYVSILLVKTGLNTYCEP